MAAERHQARFKTAEQIRAGGAIGNLQDGPVIEMHGVSTRLVAWPGNGFQTESVHVLTLRPGEESTRYGYGVAEEATLCLAGGGEVYLRGGWRRLNPGDIAYFPEGVAHALRSPAGNGDDLIVVSQITPPQFDLYEAAGFYDRGQATRRAPPMRCTFTPSRTSAWCCGRGSARATRPAASASRSSSPSTPST